MFFVTIGMMIHFRYFYSNLFRMLALLVIIVVSKGFVMALTCYVFGDLPSRVSIAAGLAISQAGEFTFVIASMVLCSVFLCAGWKPSVRQMENSFFFTLCSSFVPCEGTATVLF